ncbi:MAG: hypothetical protein QM703_10575 [Gemmatales bacterium]
MFQPKKFMNAVQFGNGFKYVCKLCGHDVDKQFSALEVLRLKETEHADGTDEHQRQLEAVWKKHKCSPERPVRFKKQQRTIPKSTEK